MNYRCYMLYTTQVCWGYVGIVEKKMETVITLGDIQGLLKIPSRVFGVLPLKVFPTCHAHIKKTQHSDDRLLFDHLVASITEAPNRTNATRLTPVQYRSSLVSFALRGAAPFLKASPFQRLK